MIATQALKSHSAVPSPPSSVSTVANGHAGKAPDITPESGNNQAEIKVYDVTPLGKVSVDLTRPMVEWLSDKTPDLHAYFLENNHNPYFGYTILKPATALDCKQAGKRKEELFNLLGAQDISNVSKGDLCLAMTGLLLGRLSEGERLRLAGVQFNVNASYNYNGALSLLSDEVTVGLKSIPREGLLQMLATAGWQVDQDEIDIAIKERISK